jgi:hypothetical protein
MNKNPAFSKALSALSQPASLVAMGMLLLNDQFLRRIYPSWLTGKLSDFAWLLFFPFVIAAILAWLLPKRMPHREQLTGLLGIGLIGAIFTLGKVFPVVNQAVLDFFSSLINIHLTILVDPTDLIALPMLWFAWRIWLKADPALEIRHARGWAALPLAALLTLGNSAAPNLGVICLQAENNALYASAIYRDGVFISQDSGLSWQLSEKNNTCSLGEDPTHQQELLTTSGTRYRFTSGENIELSTDNGQSWQVAYTILPYSEAQKVLFEKQVSGFSTINYPGPLAAIEDPQSGNIVFAMGVEGVLVHSGDTWKWIAVGTNRKLPPESAENLFTLLNQRLILAVGAGLLVIMTASAYLKRGRGWRVLFIITWLAWGFGLLMTIPELDKGYVAAATSFSVFLAALLLLIVGLEAIFRLIRDAPEATMPVTITAFTATVLFATPFVLWALNIIPLYILALAFSLVLFLAVLLPSLGRFKKIVEFASDNE